MMGHLPGADETETDDEAAIFSEINITPLTDIFLVLLIIFMVTSSVMANKAPPSPFAERADPLPAAAQGNAALAREAPHTEPLRPARSEGAHRVQAAVPGVEVADDGDGRGGRGPDREGGPLRAVDCPRMGAELVVELLVAALAGEVDVDVAQGGRERVRVLEREGVAVGIGDLELVGQRQLRPLDDGLEDPVGVHLGGGNVLVARPDRDRRRGRR